MLVTSQYMIGRRAWTRPQALLFSDNPGKLENGFFIPAGNEGENFIILSDHNRAGISIDITRIESRQRMINGSMRSYHTADKITASTSWTRLPSRSFSVSSPTFGDGTSAPEGKLIQQKVFIDSPPRLLTFDPLQHTADGGAGGTDLLAWYEAFKGPFYVFLSYDKFGQNDMNKYTQILHMYFSEFNYEVEKRGQDLFDMWNISLSLEEV
jgi:hypothetical protein